MLLAALCATACTTENELAALRAVPLTFSTSVDTQTRAATDLTTDNLTSVGVFACFTQGDFNAGTATPNFMYNQELKKEAAAWTYSPLKYWPNNENDKISFFAYAPRNAAGVTLCSNTNTGFPYLDYTVPTAEADQTDLLAATPLMNQSYSSNPTAPGSIKFTMKHALTKVSIYAKSSDLSAGKKVVNSLSVTAPKSGKLTYKADGFSWSASTDKSTYIATNTDVTIATATADEIVLLGTFYLIPERTSSSLNITYTVTGSISDNVNLPTDKPVITGQAFPDTYDWLPGASIAYTINIARTGIEIAAESSLEWTSGTVKDIEYFEANDLKPGDYYYSDGSWSDGGLRMIDHSNGQIVWKDPLPDRNLTNQQTSSARECIGVVFSTRIADTDKLQGWNHGYVVGLKLPPGTVQDGGCTNWSNGNKDTPIPNTSAGFKYYYADLDGYTKTEQVKNMDGFSENDYPAFKYVINYPVSVPAGASPWFLPAMGQLIDLWEVLGDNLSRTVTYRESTSNGLKLTSNSPEKIRKHLNKAAGKAENALDNSTDFRNGIVFLSSTEINGSNVAAINFYNWKGNYEAPVTNMSKSYYDIYGLLKAVPVLAF